MELSKNEIMLEEKRLLDTVDIIRGKISELGQELYDRDDKVLEFKKFMWDNRSDMDPTELKTMMSSNDLEISMMMKKGEYLQKLFKIQNNPYFGSIIFNDGKNIDEVSYIQDTQKEIIKYAHDDNIQAKILLAEHIEAIANTVSKNEEISIKGINSTKKKERNKRHIDHMKEGEQYELYY